MPYSEIRAPRYTPIAAGTSASAGQIVSGSVNVYGFVFTNTNSSAETSTIFENDATTTITTVRVPANTTLELTVQFLADQGISVTTATTTTCLVFHGNAGA